FRARPYRGARDRAAAKDRRTDLLAVARDLVDRVGLYFVEARSAGNLARLAVADVDRVVAGAGLDTLHVGPHVVALARFAVLGNSVEADCDGVRAAHVGRAVDAGPTAQRVGAGAPVEDVVAVAAV